MKTEKFLILDDDPIFAQSLERGLRRRGFEVQVCHDGAAAVAAAQSQVFDLVSVDLHLVQDSGLQWLPALRLALPQARILILTGYASIATTVQAMKAGADNYLPKPANIDSILSALRAEDNPAPSTTMSATPADEDELAGPMSVRRLEWEHIQRVLQEHEGNISQAARALNMHRRTLQRKLGKKPMAE